MDRTDPDLRDLRLRVVALERAAVRALCLTACALLALGAFLPLAPATQDAGDAGDSDEEQEDDILGRMVAVPFRAFGYRDSDGQVDGITIAVGVGFTGLLLCAVVAVLLLPAIGRAEPGEHTARLLSIVTVTMVVGTSIAALLVLGFASGEELDGGWGVVVFAAGVGVCLLIRSPAVRRWWDPAARP